MPTAEIVRRNDHIVSVPAIALTYSFVRDGREWVFEELRLGEESGALIDLSDTLWTELEQTGEYRLLLRSGSF
jgi:hypothetical protein